ncbi:hypothetical protein DLM76_20425 [Leptospira yasudae]|uniref:DUF2971 domain-containing protein n=1 Tax=Leptospira yasudae TaxID=2202201 RepID=UPI000E59FD8C|nr:DUF2971 domain-containing protein [Leptospira yasudae]RHX90232.1 hypothetical protein DLM76_20425 [Leptospira yasudae]
MMLYKYRSINEFTFKLILDNELYFAKPSEFNDPFDSRTKTIYHGTFNEWYTLFRRNGMNHDESKQKAEEWEGKVIDDSMLGDRQASDDENRILCLSQVRDNILMWAHYADQHRGICLGFEVTELKKSRGLELEEDDFELPNPNYPKGYLSILDVNYNNVMPPPLNLLKESPSEIFRFLLRKNEDWKYEYESRLFLVNDWIKRNPVRFKKKILKEIIFGLRMSETDKKIIRDIITKNYVENGFDVRIFQCHESDVNYQLSIN